MNETFSRHAVRFASGAADCAAWHYPGTNGACVVMAGGFAVPKEPATDLFAMDFVAVGYSVLAFDYRRLGESGGEPRLVLSAADAVADWLAAVEFARGLPEVDPAKVAVWGFSASGGFVFEAAARKPHLAAAIAQTPLASAPAAMPGVARYSTPWAQLRLFARGLIDTIGGAVGRRPILVPLIGPRGTVAMLSTPDALDGAVALDAGRYPGWEQKVAARSVLALGRYRPIRYAARIKCPLLVIVCDDDLSAPADLARRAARRAPRGEITAMSGGHYAPFMERHEEALAAQVAFLQRHLFGEPRPRAADARGDRGLSEPTRAKTESGAR